MYWMQASTQLRYSSPSPNRRNSYQSYACWTSCSASGARINSAVMTTPDPGFHLGPGDTGSWLARQIGFSPGKFLLLPIVDGDIGGRTSQIVPEVLNQLKLFGRRQVEQ